MEKKFMEEAIKMAQNGIRNNEGGPFGAVVVKNGEIIGRGNNRVTSTNDPSAHAEVVAIRDACNKLGSFQLEGCDIYTSCEPCPMCLGAIYWARPDKVYFGCTKKDAAEIDFDDDFIYRELELPLDKRKIEFTQIMEEDAKRVFQEWENKNDKISY
jgi:tRNA(Arg) A34 adenosine deaminase TadA